MRRGLSALADLAWLTHLVWRQAPRLALPWAGVELGRGLVVPAQLWLTKALVDALAAQLAAPDRTGDAWRLDWASWPTWPAWPAWLALLAATLLAERLLSGAAGWLQVAVRERASAALHERFMRHAAALDLIHLEQQTHFDRLERVFGGVENRAIQQLRLGLDALRLAPHVLGYAVGIAALSPTLAAVALLAKSGSVVAFFLGGRAQYGVFQDQSRDHRLGDYYAAQLTERGPAKEVRLYGLTTYLMGRWSELYWRTRDVLRRRQLEIELQQRFTLTAATAVTLAALVWTVSGGVPGASAGDYALLFQSVTGLGQALFSVLGIVGSLGQQSGYAADVRALLALRSAPAAQARRPLQPLQRPLRWGIEFQDVSFTYPGAARPALERVSFRIDAGEKVALVGENGAGKTTLVKLLLGLYRPDAGRITYDGLDLAALEPATVRAATSAILQQFARYPLTLRENLTLGTGAGGGEADRVSAALRRADLEAVAARLPGTWETLLGPDVGGTDLSGGEWQRLALARAFYRDAELLVLDEPTAALDPLAELALFERFVELAQGRTAVLISHRLGMARLADRVIVLRDGRVVGDGPHDALLVQGGAYAALFTAQARWYV